MKALEIRGRIDAAGNLVLAYPLELRNKEVKIIILVAEEGDEFDEAEWLKAASHNEAFDFLEEPGEDVYSLSDGSPFTDR